MSRSGRNKDRPKATAEDRIKYQDAWAKMMVDIWREKIERLHVIDTYRLHQDMNESLTTSGNEFSVIQHKFMEYGIYQDCGDSKNQRRYWLFYRYLYMDSKYHYVSTEATECISWRGQCNGCDLQMKAYAPMYICLGFGATGYAQTTRYRYTDLDSYVTVKNELKQQTQNAIFYLFNGRMITELGDLYKFGNIQELNLASAIRLEILRLGIHTDKVTRQYVNTMQQTLNLAACVAMRILDLTNCEGFGNGGNYVLDCVNLVSLEEFYGYGSSLTGVNFAQTPTLHTIELGAMMKQLRLIGLTGLETFSIQAVDSLTTLTVTGTSSVDTYDIAQRCFSANSPLTAVNIDGINWAGTDIAVLNYLASVRSCQLKGYIYILGTNSVTFAMKQSLIAKFGAVDSADNAVHMEYNVRSVGSISIAGDTYIRKAGQYQFRCQPNTNYGNDFVDIKWSLSNNSYATIDEKTGLLTATSVGEELYKPQATLTCTMTKTDGSKLTATRVIGLYDRSAQVGDYVYADGSYSDIEDNNKTVVGICYYINPDDPTDRRMVAVAPIGSYAWGLMPNRTDQSDSWNETYAIPGIQLSDNPSYSVYDIPSIDNIGSSGSYDGTSYIKDANIRDESDTGDADGFRIYPTNRAYGDMQLVTLTSDYHGYKAGTKVPVGLLKTLRIIDHRDTILNDSGVNLPLPSANALQTETQNLKSLIDEIVSLYGANKYAQYYYPAASYCHAYEPTTLREGEELNPKFKAHNWYLPSSGELARLYWYHSKGYEIGKEFAIFARASTAKLFTKFNSSNHWSCSENSSYNSWYVNFNDGYFHGNGKTNSTVVRAVAAF